MFEIFSIEPLSLETLAKFQKDFYSDAKNVLAQNVCTRFDPFEVCINKKQTESSLHVYNIKVFLYFFYIFTRFSPITKKFITQDFFDEK